jgi:hypothetical protein
MKRGILFLAVLVLVVLAGCSSTAPKAVFSEKITSEAVRFSKFVVVYQDVKLSSTSGTDDGSLDHAKVLSGLDVFPEKIVSRGRDVPGLKRFGFVGVRSPANDVVSAIPAIRRLARDNNGRSGYVFISPTRMGYWGLKTGLGSGLITVNYDVTLLDASSGKPVYRSVLEVSGGLQRKFDNALADSFLVEIFEGMKSSGFVDYSAGVKDVEV